MNDREPIEYAEDAVKAAESSYMQGWTVDAERWEQYGLYKQVAEITAPRDGRFTWDAGTGLGHQLIWLAGINPKGLYVGTERTPFNVELARDYWAGKGIDMVTILQTQALHAMPDRRLYWAQRNLAAVAAMRSRIRELLERHILITDDDTRNPQVLPAILGTEKLEAAILSLPGGSSMRAYEWPFHPAQLEEQEERARVVEASDSTRLGFYHYASQAVRDGGKIVIAERAGAAANITPELGLGHVAKTMRGYTKYWKAGRVALASHPIPDNVKLKATFEGKQYDPQDLVKLGYAMHVVIVELLRNTVEFNEPPRPLPSE